MSTPFRKSKHAAARLHTRAAYAARSKERTEREAATWWRTACADGDRCLNGDNSQCPCVEAARDATRTPRLFE